MGIWRRWASSRRRSSSPIAIDRKVIRFRRLVEQHGEVLDLFADLKDKQSGEYILDRQYIEARLDRAYEGVRRILYDMHVLSDSNSADGYDQLDRLRSVSEKILLDAQKDSDQPADPKEEEAPDWETLALQALFQDLTRLPVYGDVTESRTETAWPAPESLTEWAGWGHAKAAQWITDQLPHISPAPFTSLRDEGMEEFGIQVFVLGGAPEAQDTLSRFLVRDPSAQAETLSLLPLRTFLEGLRSPTDGNGMRRLCLQVSKKQETGDKATQLQLYAGEDFLLIRFPSFLPLQLFWCSLSLQPTENLLYLYGTPFPLLSEPGTLEPFSSEKEPFPIYRCSISGRWMYWASHFSWAQGEERVRMLGHSLAEGLTVGGAGAPQGTVSQRLQEGIAGFLKQTAMPQREA